MPLCENIIRRYQVIHGWMSMLLTNLPFLIIRILVRTKFHAGGIITLMAVKNVLFIMMQIRHMFNLMLKSKDLIVAIEPH